ncbi:helix-turn-helix domain-containing protein [Chryseobacterium indologenes]|uniref:helix-turn-helix domain-containing protein n=1 Tax=Chryseobacterium indologenes TaxID=253 RepID=UPI0007883CD2|nr:AraC family transcriptional regulator [Chryseobacterium indologenes]
MLIKKSCFIVFHLLSAILLSQEVYSDYYKLKREYENYPENDKRAFPYINSYINKAKREKKYAQLVQGYKDAVFYSYSEENKLKYADSTIIAAKLLEDKDAISDAYLGKGIIYYFNYKKYKPALDEYLKAYEYSLNTKNDYLRYKILYHLGVVKSYLGYYDEAAVHFKETVAFFEKKSKEKNHPNIIFNNRKGYFNSLHQMIICYRNTHHYKAADSLISIGLSKTLNTKDFRQENGYFLKERGIGEYRRKEYQKAIHTLDQSLKPLLNINDFAWATVDYFYIGKSYLGIGDSKNGISYFQKVDSVFQKHSFILPELRENYELLVKYNKEEKNTEQELYYTNQLLKVDSVISKDFTYLASRIHKEYDTKTLEGEKARLEKEASWNTRVIAGLVFIVVILIIILIIRYKKEKEIRVNYRLLEKKILNKNNDDYQEIPVKPKNDNKLELDSRIIDDLLAKLKDFEEKNKFTENGLTLNKLAAKFNTNSNYLSQVVNECKGTNFNRYLSELRINYITNKLYNDKKYLNYKIETLAEKCGIASRTNFSNLFQEINGIRPTDFIKKRNQDLGKEQNFSVFNKKRETIQNKD